MGRVCRAGISDGQILTAPVADSVCIERLTRLPTNPAGKDIDDDEFEESAAVNGAARHHCARAHSAPP
jgi:hypothetical protein